MFTKARILFCLFLAMALLIAACDSTSDEATEDPTATSAPTEVNPTATDAPEETEVVIPPTATDAPEEPEDSEATEDPTPAAEAQSADEAAEGDATTDDTASDEIAAADTDEDTEGDALVTEEPIVVELDTAATIEVAPDAPNETRDGVYRFSVSRGTDDYQNAAYPVEDGQRLFLLELSIETTGSGTVITPQAIAILDEAGNRYAPVEPTEDMMDDLLNQPVTADQRLSGVVVFALPEAVVPETVAWCPNETCDQPLTQFVRAFSSR